MNRLTIITLAVLMTGLIIGPVRADNDCLDYGDYLRIAGHVETPGRAFDVAWDGSHAFVADEEGGLQVLDVSDSDAPIIVGSLDFDEACNAVVVHDGYAFLSVGSDRLMVVDVSVPEAPVLRASLGLPGPGGRLFLEWPFLYIRCDGNTILIVDVSDPEDPESVSSVPVEGLIYGHTVEGDRMVVTSEEMVHLFDCSQISAPVLIGSISLPGTACYVDLEGDVIWVTVRYDGLYALEIDGLAGLEVISYLPDVDGTRGMVVSEGRVHALGFNWYLTVVDGTDPENPEVEGRLATFYPPWNLTLADDRILLANADHGLVVVTYESFQSPQHTGFLGVDATIEGINYTGGELFISCGHDDVYWLDITDPDAPAVLAHIPTLSDAGEVWYRAPYLYVADGAYFLVIDVSDPEASQIVSGVHILNSGYSYSRAVEGEGDHAYLATDWGLVVVDVSDPHGPSISGTLEVPGASSTLSRDLEVRDGLAYLACAETGLHIIDVTDPTNPIWLDQVDGSNRALGVTLWDEYALVSEGPYGLIIVGISDPLHADVVGEIMLSGNPISVAVHQDIAYVASYWAGLQLVDLSHPTEPVWLGSMASPLSPQALAYGVVNVGDRIYMDQEDLGVLVAFPQCTDTPAGLDETPALMPTAMSLSCRPNPFNPRTVFHYEMDTAARVELAVYDLAGRLVRTLRSGVWQEAGSHVATWDGRDDGGASLPSGSYLGLLRVGGQEASTRLGLLK